jgi:hypothetical protein
MDGVVGYQFNRDYNSHRDQTCDIHGENGSLYAEEAEEALLTAEANNFVGWFLHIGASVDRRCSKQLFFHTLFARYHGLSRYGQDVMASFGQFMKRSTYDAMIITTVKERIAQAKSAHTTQININSLHT